MGDEVRQLVVRCCCAAGGLAGLWLGFLAALGKPGSPDAAAALMGVLLPVSWRVVAGVVAGACLASLVSAAVPWLRPTGR